MGFLLTGIGRSSASEKESLAHSAIVNIIGDQASQRTVGLRKASQKERRLSFYTDFRSAKISQKNEELSFSCLFYNEAKQIQLRVQTEEMVVSDEESDKTYC